MDRFDHKVDRSEFKTGIAPKLDAEIFHRLFPRETPPSDTLKQLVRVHAEALNKRVIEMVKLWDQKIVNLRGELNIQGIKKRLDRMALKEDLSFQMNDVAQQNEKVAKDIKALKQTLDARQNELESIYAKIELIYGR